MPRLHVPVTDRDHQRGPAHASVTLVEYGDFQCPLCGQAFHVLRDLERFQNDVRFVYAMARRSRLGCVALGLRASDCRWPRAGCAGRLRARWVDRRQEPIALAAELGPGESADVYGVAST
jgi:hypothetical protein